MTRVRAIFAALVCVRLALGSGLGADPAPPPQGRWQGAIALPGQKLEVSVTLSPGDGGAWKGSIDIPAQGARGLALEPVKVESAAVTFSITGIPGDPTFAGTLSPDGATLAGDFTQAGQTFPFSLARSEPGRAPSALDGFDAWVRGQLEVWNVPGVSVAIVKNGEVILAKGYGLRDVGRKLPVTADTLFAIGSATKAFTATGLAVLADAGKLEWDEPVRTYLPAFALKDPSASSHITPRDLVTHRSGLPRHDLVWYNAPLSRKAIVERLRHLEPNADLRQKWQYQNLMFLTAGYLAGELAGTSWEEVVRSRIFVPLGMTASNFSVEESKKTADFALPYNEKEGSDVLQQIPFRNIDAVGPAGSINSTASDMARWVRLQLSDGAPVGTRVLGAASLRELHQPQMVIPETGRDPEIVLPSYAMGWFVESYRGKTRVHHGGNIDGFSAMVTFLPADDVGVVVLANKDGTPLPEIVCRAAIDRLLELPSIDWSARIKARVDEGEKAAEKAKDSLETLERKKGTKPSHALDEYAGEYEHPAYGTITVAREGPAGLRATLHAIPMRLEHWHYDTFLAHPEDPALEGEKLFVLFRANAKGDLESLTIPLEPQVDEIAFLRKPPARLFDPAFLGTLTGEYTMVDQPSVTATVTLEGDTLNVVLPGQPPYTLEPYRGTEFRLEELTGYSLRFVLDAQGRVREALFVQPDGVYAARRKP